MLLHLKSPRFMAPQLEGITAWGPDIRDLPMVKSEKSLRRRSKTLRVGDYLQWARHIAAHSHNSK
jgi:hypothetical protein